MGGRTRSWAVAQGMAQGARHMAQGKNNQTYPLLMLYALCLTPYALCLFARLIAFENFCCSKFLVRPARHREPLRRGGRVFDIQNKKFVTTVTWGAQNGCSSNPTVPCCQLYH